MSRFTNKAKTLSFSKIEIIGDIALLGPIKKFQYEMCCEASDTLAKEVDIHIPTNPNKIKTPFLEIAPIEGDAEIKLLVVKGLTKPDKNNKSFLEFTTNAAYFGNMRSGLIHREFRTFFFHNFLRNHRKFLDDYTGKDPSVQITRFRKSLADLSKKNEVISGFCEFDELLKLLNRTEQKLLTIRKSLQPSKGASWIPETILIERLHQRRKRYSKMKPEHLETYVPKLNQKQIAYAMIAYGVWLPFQKGITLSLLADEGVDRIKAALRRAKKKPPSLRI